MSMGICVNPDLHSFKPLPLIEEKGAGDPHNSWVFAQFNKPSCVFKLS